MDQQLNIMDEDEFYYYKYLKYKKKYEDLKNIILNEIESFDLQNNYINNSKLYVHPSYIQSSNNNTLLDQLYKLLENKPIIPFDKNNVDDINIKENITDEYNVINDSNNNLKLNNLDLVNLEIDNTNVNNTNVNNSNVNNIIELTNNNFEEHIKKYSKKNNKLIILFYRPGCPYCDMFMPIYIEFSQKQKNNNVFISQMNTANNSLDKLDIKYRQYIEGVPTILKISNNIITKFEDNRTVENLNNFILK